MSRHDLQQALTEWWRDDLRFASQEYSYRTCPYLTQTGDKLCRSGCYDEPICVTGSCKPLDTRWERSMLRFWGSAVIGFGVTIWVNRDTLVKEWRR